MQTFSLQSGSNGNSILVEAGGVSLLFDAGISGTVAEQRMATHGRHMRDVHALIISHDHADHVRGAGVFQRKFGLPIYMTRATREAIWAPLGRLTDVRFFVSGDRLTFGPVTVHTIRTPHDAVDGVMFVVEHERKRLGVFTDLGHPFDELLRVLEDVDAAYLESNYDPEMLESGSYPFHLRARIRGPGGHLSNDEAAEVVSRCRRNRPRWVALAHLSGKNNQPAIAIDTHRRVIGDGYPVCLAPRDGASDIFHI